MGTLGLPASGTTSARKVELAKQGLGSLCLFSFSLTAAGWGGGWERGSLGLLWFSQPELGAPWVPLVSQESSLGSWHSVDAAVSSVCVCVCSPGSDPAAPLHLPV